MAPETEALTVSPLRPPGSTSGTRRRKSTPLAEQGSPQKSTVLTPLGAVGDDSTVLNLTDLPSFASSTPLFGSPILTIHRRSPITTTHAHPTVEAVSESTVLHPSRHVVLPFNLKENADAFSGDNLNTLENLFPNTNAVSFDGHFLVFWLRALPPKPWPVTIAGVPPYFTTDSKDDGPMASFSRRMSRSSIHISREVDARGASSDGVEDCFRIVQAHFETAGIGITEIQHWGNFLAIVLEDEDTDLSRVPNSIAKCRCLYVFETEMHRPQELSPFRAREPSDDGVIDNTPYSNLRPGVMLGSGRTSPERPEYLTSSGALVEDAVGNRYMTVSARGFPYGEAVFHPSAGIGRQIGKVIMEITHTDVGLVQLEQDIAFENVPFESTADEASIVTFSEFVPAGALKFGDYVYLNSPFTGYIDGIYGPHTTTRVPIDDPYEPKMIWIRTQWSYLGQDSGQVLEDGICGSAIWAEGGKVVGFFRYAPKTGAFRDWCLTVSSEEIAKKGFKIAT